MIGIVPIGKVDEFTLKVIAAHITGYLHLEAELYSSLENPVSAYDSLRMQYDAGKIITHLESKIYKSCAKIIGIFNDDIFVPIFTHVFGEARQGGGHALVSLYRLDSSLRGKEIPHTFLAERASKVALHELGHLFNLSHCQDELCIMHFSSDLTCLDKIPFYFCRCCSYTFKKNMDMYG